MNVPGANILSIALRVIRPQTLIHHAFVSRAVNSTGDYVSTYAAPVTIEGSIQAVNQNLYQQLGLNFAKNYSNLYTSANVTATHPDREGDIVEFGGRFWQAMSDQDWRDVEGWRRILCVEVPSL